MFDYDGENLRSLKEDLIGRIGIENILILLEIIYVSSPIIRFDHNADLAA
jgi:hypothetical protein